MAPPKRRCVTDGEESEVANSIKEMMKNQNEFMENQKEMMTSQKLMTESHKEMVKTQYEMKENHKMMSKKLEELEKQLARNDDKKKIIEKEFVLKYTFKKVLDMTDGSELFQPSQEHFGRKWFIYIKRKDEHLSVNLATEKPNATGEWLIETDQELEIAVGRDSTFNKHIGRMHNKGNAYGLPKFVSWEEMKRRYSNNGDLIVQARAKILNMTGIVRPKVFDFGESHKKHSDMVLKVGNEKFHVWKGFLSRHSHFFDALFSRNFKEGQPGTKEIELPETDAQDFQNFLEVLHGDSRPDDFTIEGILHRNDIYHAKNVLRECEDFLIYKSEKTLRKKLELSSRYQLNSLADKCVSEITPKEYKDLVEDGFVQEAGLYVSRALNKRSVTFF